MVNAMHSGRLPDRGISA